MHPVRGGHVSVVGPRADPLAVVATTREILRERGMLS